MSTPNQLTQHTTERLAFARLLHLEAVDQSHRPAPFDKFSILLFHDAVEHFLILACEHVGAVQPREFMKYWTEMTKVGTPLAGQIGMDRLNRCRRDFKHAGAPPSQEDIELARSDTASFFEENTPRVFGLDYAAIDMVDLIPQAEARQLVQKSREAQEKGDRLEAMALLREAFDAVFLGRSDRDDWGSGPFSIGPTLRRVPGTRKFQSVLVNDGLRSAGEVAEYLEAIAKIVEPSQTALRVLVLGLNYQEYVRFVQLSPRVSYTMDMSRHVDAPPGYAPTADHFTFCLQFVIRAALKSSETEAAATAPWSSRKQERRPSIAAHFHKLSSEP
ncbi:hypothetical protein [Actinomadura atramentaria]|uniref:hypothetical protein n=1 Tax=Actinomadura atramentaria TaxID=1990 RepID=UPI0012F8FAA7|nr:hypothetical protein [Actinomadura atramentaria]